ncbi:hypothetical protein NKI96_10575 [Mesorhizobium sp. M0292]|uniref:hypothetical protein n=1 Tax=Mesorhizobium sp. M0292 TaxID=2956929 RepID=UPI00333C71F5
MLAGFPPYRHLIVKNDAGKFTTEILVETPHQFSTPNGLFDKATGRQWGHPEVSFVGPFTADGDMENRP